MKDSAFPVIAPIRRFSSAVFNIFPSFEQSPRPIADSLLICLTGDRAKTARCLESHLDQAEALIQTASTHKLDCLLWQRLVALELLGALPPPARAMLAARVSYQQSLTVKRQQQLSRILEKLNAAGIPVVVLKGAYLAVAVYAEPAQRPMVDLDILCRQSDLLRVQTLLMELGYRPERHETIEDVCLWHHQLPPLLRGSDASVDIHWRIERPRNRLKVDHDGLWERSRAWVFADQAARVLSPEDLLLHLCLHLGHHHRCQIGLYALFDITFTIQKQPADWSILVTRAREWRAAFPVGLALALARDMAGAEVPESVLAALAADRHSAYWLTVAKREILTPRGNSFKQRETLSDRDRTDRLVYALMDPRSTPGWRGIASLLASRLLPPRAELARRYPYLGAGYRLILIYPFHGLLLTLRYAKALLIHWQRWRNTQKLIRRLGS